jgi:hypothetical protein
MLMMIVSNDPGAWWLGLGILIVFVENKTLIEA